MKKLNDVMNWDEYITYRIESSNDMKSKSSEIKGFFILFNFYFLL